MMMNKHQLKSLALILLLLQLPRVITADDTTPDGATPDEITSPVTTPTPVTTPIPPDDPLTLKKFLKDVNDMRRHYAKKFHVPNMHELIWSDELKNLPASDWEYHNPTVESFVVAVVPSYEIRDTIDNAMVNYDGTPDSWSETLELMMPMQTFLGCVPITGRKKCLMGPHLRNRKMFDVSGKSREVPGSKCQPKFKNVNGLCVAKDPTKMSYFHGNPREFVKNVNLVRQKYAKEYNVAYMRKLVWNDSLVEIAKGLNWKEDVWHQARITWRYEVTIYPGIIEALTQEVEELSKKPVNDQEKHLDTSDRGFLLLVELLNPRQSQIGCVYMESDPDFANLCLLGGSGAFELWDFNKKCSTGYVMDDGLCTISTASNRRPSAEKQSSKDKKRADGNEKELMERVRLLESKLENAGSIATFSFFSVLLCVVMFHFSD